MKRPRIGITTGHDTENQSYLLKYSYVQRIAQAGGLPVLLPADEAVGNEESYAEILDGIVFSGGGDIHPAYFKEEPEDGFSAGKILPQRDSFEIQLYREAEKRKLPMLGICRGIQVMAVAAGGTIYQDIENGMKRRYHVRHMQTAPDWCETHMVHVADGTKLFEIYQIGQIMTNSFHHQAIKQVPEGYRVSAWSTDGVVEGIESAELPFCLGVQWHPERMAERDERTAALFAEFVKSAEKYKNPA